ncbi:MAG: hypothetical protein JXA00_00760 [Candidatus Thermoplasmatota archaeon]|nr:hypothetical protein [Candidatus Thermoplasmatota archaeon]
MTKKSIILFVILSVIIVSIGVYWFVVSPPVEETPPDESGYLLFQENLTTNTLTVTEIHGLTTWEDIEVYSGHALVPTGPIDLGDVVMNCTGNVQFLNTKDQTIFTGYDFSE